MIRNKPVVGILATPYIKNNISNEIFLKENLITFLMQKSIDHIIIPYSITKLELNKILPNLDGLLFPGSQRGNLYNNKFINGAWHIYQRDEKILSVLENIKKAGL